MLWQQIVMTWQYIYLSFYLSFYLSIYHLSIYHLFIYPSVYLSIYQYIHTYRKLQDLESFDVLSNGHSLLAALLGLVLVYLAYLCNN